jgi:hypothetical protein
VAPFDLTVRTLAVRATRRVHENSIPSINSTLPLFSVWSSASQSFNNAKSGF